MASTKSQDAIALLKEDHRTAEKLFKDFESAKGDGRKEKLARQICLALSIHFELEEQIFYPACKGTVDEDELKEGYVEHDAAKLLVAEIEANEGGGDEFFDTKVHVLSEEIEHHIQEEEGPGGIFSQARKGKLDLDALGEQLVARKEELSRRYKEAGLPEPELTTMDEVSV
ncbi:MAG TPA: hemerythrin domain-containing protein [Sphingomicrobium sp.]|nr:hemerythrin domain-containing protein [Sphingomicrobium sp.]